MRFQLVGNQLRQRVFRSGARANFRSNEKDLGKGQEKWQKDIDNATGSFAGNILNSSIDLSALFVRLRTSTERYLRRQGTISTNERDHRLSLLVQRAPDKPIAIIACATALTRSALRSLLATHANVDLNMDSTIVAHLRTIEAVSTVNPYTIDAAEIKKVQSLRRLLDRGRFDFLVNLQAYYSVEGAGTLEDIFPPGFIQQLLGRMCSNFRTTLESYRAENDWVSAHSLICKLPALMNTSRTFSSVVMNFLPTWRSWNAWQPNHKRISAWIRISRGQRLQLKEVLDLDGPDFVFESHRTLFEAFMVRSREHGLAATWQDRFMEQIRTIESDVAQFVYRVLQYLSNIRDSSISIDVFIHFYSRSQIDANRMAFLEGLSSTGNTSLFSSLYSILSSPEILLQVSEMSKMLDTLNGALDEELLKCLSAVFKDIAESGVRAIQENLRLAFESGGDPYNVIHQLLRLREGLEKTKPLHQILNASTLEALQNLPTSEDSDALLDLRRDTSKFADEDNRMAFLDEYCKVLFTNQGTLEEESKAITGALVPIWRKPAHAQRKLLATSLMSCHTLPAQIRCQCIQQVHGMEESYVRKIDAVVQAGVRGAYMACPGLATILRLKGFQKKYDQGCWADLLLWMIEYQGTDLVQTTVNHMDMSSWLNWLEQLRIILGEKMNHSPAAILVAGLHEWSRRLKEEHSTAIAALDRLAIPVSFKEWILLARKEDHEPAAQMLTSIAHDEERCSAILREFLLWVKGGNLVKAPIWAAVAKRIKNGDNLMA